MRKASIRDLHVNTSALVREAADGATIIIERRGKPVAELAPIRHRKAITPEQGISPERKAQIFASMKKIWDSMPQGLPDSTDLVSEDRDRY